MSFRLAAIALAIAGLITAIVAAIYWYKASQVTPIQTTASISDVPERYILSNQVAFAASSTLNAKAALWTGASALLNATATVLSLL